VRRKTPASRPSRQPKVPAILLQGDRPAPPPVSGPGERYVLGPTPPPEPQPSPESQLPEAYGTKRLFLVARDPEWLYAQWDLTRAQQRSANARSADGHMILRVHLERLSPAPLLDVHLHSDSRHALVRVGRGSAAYVAELGYYRRRDHAWQQIAVSEVACTPGARGQEAEGLQYATIPPEASLRELATRVRGAGGPVPSAGRAPGRPPQAVPVAMHLVGMPASPQMQEQGGLAGQPIATAQMGYGATAAAEVGQAVGQSVARPGEPVVPPATSPSGAFGSVSSPFGGAPVQAKGFWFNINAELVVYGATEPNATVTIGGRVVPLREDGTFSCRFALPDGAYELPATAVSADGTDGRAAELQFSRVTRYHGAVGTAAGAPLPAPPAAQDK